MHFSYILALFAAGAIAQPALVKKDVDIVTETQVKTVVVTAGAQPAAPTGGSIGGGWHLVGSDGSDSPAPAAPAPHKKHGHAHAHLHSSGGNAAAGASDDGSDASMTASGSTDYQKIVLLHHNIHRKNHTVPALTWDDSMASLAQAEAEVCVFAHNVTGGYGQNIAAGVSPERVSDAITGMFYNNEVNYYQYYGQADPMANFESWGHFSQMVWKDTTGVGCATVHCPGGIAEAEGTSPYFTVCNYSPAGNMGGDFATNVLKTDGNPSISPDYGLSNL